MFLVYKNVTAGVGAVLLCDILKKMYNLGLKNWKQLNVYLSNYHEYHYYFNIDCREAE